MTAGKLRKYLRNIPDDTEVWLRVKSDIPLEDVIYVHNEELKVKYCILSGEKNVKKFN